MAGKIRYRVYGVVDEETEGIEPLLDEIRQYGSAYLIDSEVVEEGAELPDAEDDFKERYSRKEGK